MMMSVTSCVCVYVYQEERENLFFPGVSSMMMMMMTGARVDLCNKSALLRERKTTDKMNVQKQK